MGYTFFLNLTKSIKIYAIKVAPKHLRIISSLRTVSMINLQMKNGYPCFGINVILTHQPHKLIHTKLYKLFLQMIGKFPLERNTTILETDLFIIVINWYTSNQKNEHSTWKEDEGRVYVDVCGMYGLGLGDGVREWRHGKDNTSEGRKGYIDYLRS